MRAVFFDLDGTLLGMEMEAFLRDYLRRLSAYAAPMGYEPKDMADAMWQCTAAVIANDGTVSNVERFWQAFAKLCGERVYDDREAFHAFYRKEFHAVKEACVADAAAARAAVAAGQIVEGK